MKLLHIIPTYIPAYRYGGPIRSVHYLNKWLAKKGVEVIVYTTNIDGDKELDVPINQPVNVDGIKVYYFKSSFPRSWYFSRDLSKALKKHIKEFDLVHITSVFLASSVVGAYYAKKFNKPYIISPRGSLMEQPFKKKLLKKKPYCALIENKNLRNAAAIHFTAEVEKRDYEKLGLPLKKSIIIPNGIDFEDVKGAPKGYFREKFKIGKDKKIVLFLSRLDWTKGLDTLIPAFAEVTKNRNDVVLAIAGGDDEGYGKNLKSQISNLPRLASGGKIEDKVIFTGLLTGSDKIGAFQDSDVFVLPSYSESFGMAAVEAMYFGLPTVITNGVAIAEEVFKNNAGLVVEKNEVAVSEAILKILSNEPFAKKLGEKAAAFVREEYSPEKIAEEFIRAYNEIIK